MKINKKILKNIGLIFVLFAIYNQILCSNLKLKKFKDIDLITTPPNNNNENENKKNEDSKYDINTAIYITNKLFEQIKKLKNDNSQVYNQCLQNCITPNANTPLKNLWEYFSSINFEKEEDIIKDPFNKFCDEAMSEEKLIVNKIKVNCDDICKNTSVDSFDKNMQKDIKSILYPYFGNIEFSGVKKNLITAYIGTYRNTVLGRALPRKLNTGY
jgi:hypothetical protein